MNKGEKDRAVVAPLPGCIFGTTSVHGLFLHLQHTLMTAIHGKLHVAARILMLPNQTILEEKIDKNASLKK